MHEIPPETLRTLLKVESAVWEDRNSIRAGATLGHPVFWSTDSSNSSLVNVLVGPDDETWQVSVQVPTKTLLRAVAAAEPSRDISATLTEGTTSMNDPESDAYLAQARERICRARRRQGAWFILVLWAPLALLIAGGGSWSGMTTRLAICGTTPSSGWGWLS